MYGQMGFSRAVAESRHKGGGVRSRDHGKSLQKSHCGEPRRCQNSVEPTVTGDQRCDDGGQVRVLSCGSACGIVPRRLTGVDQRRRVDPCGASYDPWWG